MSLCADAASLPAAVTASDVDEYAAALAAFASWYGVRLQLRALAGGLSAVLPAPLVLGALSPAELRAVVCGSPAIEWDMASLKAHVRVGAGHRPGDAAVTFFFQALVAMTQRERADFLHFATGNPSLPPSGLAGLDPPLQLTRKDAVQPPPGGGRGGSGAVVAIDDDAAGDGAGARRRGPYYSAAVSAAAAASRFTEATRFDYTEISCSSCFHQLKLPAYSSLAVMQARLRAAICNSAGLMDLS
jgi:hypothetical protein